MKSPNKVFVTGASGKIGKKLVAELLSRGYRVVALKTDINNIDGYREDLKLCDYVYHLAAYQNVKDKKIDEFERVNVEGTKTILEVAVKSKVKKFIYVSTVMVYDDTGDKLRGENWTKKVKSNNFYEETKIRTLKIVDKYKGKLPMVIVYPTIVVEDEDFEKFNFPGWLMCRIGSPNRILNFINNHILVASLVNIIKSDKVTGDYILGGKNITAGDYLKSVHKFKKMWYIPWHIPGIKLQNMCFSSEKAKKDLILFSNQLDIF